jgi:hypothetical protein
MKPFHRATQLHDVCELAPNLRSEDKREVNTLGKTSEQALLSGYLFGKVCRSIINNYGQVVGMYGVVPADSKTGLVWMLGSDKLKKIKIPFLKESRTEVEKMNTLFPHLWNIIDSRNEMHLKWIKWCGFKIIGERMVNNVKFYEFCKVAD